MNNRNVLSVPGREETPKQPLDSEAQEYSTDTHEHAPIIEWVFVVGQDLKDKREFKIQSEDI
jgi:hypothetical protein